MTKDYLNSNKNDYNLRYSLEKVLYEYYNKKHKSTKFKPFYLFNSNDKNEWMEAINNNNKLRKFNDKNASPFKEKDKVLICKVFKLNKKKITYKKLTKKGNYCLLAIIHGIASSHEYFVKFVLDEENLNIKKNIKYICDYRLIKACSNEAFNIILKNLNNE